MKENIYNRLEVEFSDPDTNPDFMLGIDELNEVLQVEAEIRKEASEKHYNLI